MPEGYDKQPEIRILYEDNHILVVEKPVNVPVQADESSDPDMLSLLKEYIRVKHQKPGNVYLGLVHRLDRPVGGVMVFAKTSKAASRLSDQIRRGAFHKEYLAVVHGRTPDAGHLEDDLWKDERTNTVHIVGKDGARFPGKLPGQFPGQFPGKFSGQFPGQFPGQFSGQAKHAILDYTALEHTERFSLVRIRLYTGRSHQIRVQMAGAGFPLYGDQRYGMDVNKPGQQIALWSEKVKLLHPTRKEWMEFCSRPPLVEPWKFFHGFPDGSLP